MREAVKQGATNQKVRRFGGFAVLCCAIGCVFLWVATILNNFYLSLGFISDSYLPVAALFLVVLLAGLINPYLRRIGARFALSRQQLAVIAGVWLVASVIPGQGLMRQLPFMLGMGPVEASTLPQISKAYEEMQLPEGLFPAPMKYGESVAAAEHFIDELPSGAPIPWRAWSGPLLYWGSFLMVSWLMMLGLAGVVYPQWRHNERLPFPLLGVMSAPFEDPEPGSSVAPIFRSKLFWISLGVILLIYVLLGLNTYFPSRVPAFPLKWNLRRCVEGTILRNLPSAFHTNYIYFAFLGVAFFMPTRISFSLWFVPLLYAIHQVIVVEYFPPHNWQAYGDHRTGAMLSLGLFVLWLGRAHWRNVFRCMFTRGSGAELRRNRRAGWMFVSGLLGMFAWLKYMGLSSGWSLFLVADAFLVCLLISRLVAETGMPFLRIEGIYPTQLITFAPTAWLTTPVVFFSGMLGVIFQVGSRVNATVMATHASALAEDPSVPGDDGRRSIGSGPLLAVLMVGVLIAGATVLAVSYRNGSTLDGKSRPISSFGAGKMTSVHDGLTKFAHGGFHPSRGYNQKAAVGFGAVAAAGLQWACLNIPRWPLHPVGLIVANTFYGNYALPSLFWGWLLKVLILKYGGARLYRTARPVFIGMILGEVLAAVMWSIISTIPALLGLPYKSVGILPG